MKIMALAAMLPVIAASANDLALARQQQPQAGVAEYVAAVNIPNQNAKMRAAMTIPAGLARIRCLAWIVHQGLLSEQLYAHAQLRRMLAEMQCGVVLASLQQIVLTPTDPIPATAGDLGVAKLLDQLASETGHRELTNAPLLFWGFSASGSFGTTYGALHPARTIGFVRYHSGPRVAVAVDKVKAIPALIIAGGMDEAVGVEDKELWQAGRSMNAPWTFVVEPHAQHSSSDIHQATASTLTVPWIAAVIRQRVTDQGTLKPLTLDTTWVGDLTTGNIFPQPESNVTGTGDVWLPDSAAAKGWQAVRNAGPIEPKPRK